MTMDVYSVLVDGHEIWKWVEPRTIQISQMKGWIQGNLAFPRRLSRIYDAIPIIPIANYRLIFKKEQMDDNEKNPQEKIVEIVEKVECRFAMKSTN